MDFHLDLDLVQIQEFFNILLCCFLDIFLEPFVRSGEYILDVLYVFINFRDISKI